VLVPYAGGTSLEAHWAAPPEQPGVKRKVVSVDFALMDEIGQCDVANGDVEVGPGVKYEDLNEHLKEQGIDLFFPVDPGPGAAFGGMMATGGSGTNAVRYGTMRGDYIINATVVLPNGEVITTRSRSRKSSVGPDLTKIFLGSEGTLGLIVKARIRLAPLLPTSIVVVPFNSIHDACSAAQKIIMRGVGVQCIELLDDEMLKVINIANEKTYGKGSVQSHHEKPSLFIKLQGSKGHRKEDESVVREIAGKLGARDRDIESSHDAENNERLWRARKVALWSCQEAMPERPEYKDRADGDSGWKVWTTDVSVPVGSMADLFEKVRNDTRTTGLHAPIVGHIGDGGAHSIIVFKDGDQEEFKKVKAFVNRLVDYAHQMEGTCTSEHGIGRGKRMYLERELGAGTVALLRTLKNAIDPHNIMNPGSLLYERQQEYDDELAELENLAKKYG
jgi:D-lactate dehydrogenase (cytochrome)